jgi:DNA repair exonuclease SbcCD ATPase subunit
MKRYFICSKKKEKTPEFVEGTPVEVLSPLYKQLQSLPTKKEELQILDYELIEQLNLLQAEYNRRFQEAKYCIAKDDMLRGVHYLNRSNDVKKRIVELEKRHTEIQNALEVIVMTNPALQPLRIRIPR